MSIKHRQNEILNALSLVNIFNENGTILPWSSVIWKEIIEKLNLYVFIVLNLIKLFTKIINSNYI